MVDNGRHLPPNFSGFHEIGEVVCDFPFLKELNIDQPNCANTTDNCYQTLDIDTALSASHQTSLR